MKIKKSHLKELVKQHIKENWWDMLEPDEQAAYIKAHPKSQKAQDAKKKKKKSDDEPRAATPATDKDDKRPAKNPFSKESPAHEPWNKARDDEDEYSSNTDGQGGLPLSKDDLKDPEVRANIKKRNTSTPDHPSEDDFFKHHADRLNKQADAGNSAMVDTEYNGAIAIDYVDREERRIIGSDEDGEQVELDYGDVIRFWNPDTDLDGSNESEKEKQTKETDNAAKEFGHKNAESLAMNGSVDDIWNFQDELYDKGYLGNNEMDRITKLSRRLDKSKNPKKERQEIFKLLTVDEPKRTPYYESVRESKGRRCTVKEIKKWFKSLEENRYKKTYASDARRVSWFVNNNLSEDYDTMPTSMRKKWSKAAYGRERYLAKEYIKHLKSRQMNENKLRGLIRKIIKEQLNEGPRDFIHHSEAKFIHIPKKDVKKAQKLLKKFKWQTEIEPKPSRKVPGHHRITTTKKMFNKALETLVKNKINPRG